MQKRQDFESSQTTFHFRQRPVIGRSKPVPNRFGTGCPVGNDWNRTSDNRTLEVESTGRPITGQLCPIIRRCLKTGGIYNRTCFKNAENRTSGFRMFTVQYVYKKIENGLA